MGTTHLNFGNGNLEEFDLCGDVLVGSVYCL